MKKLYSIDVKVCATAYVQARSKKEALAMLQEHGEFEIYLDERDDDISGLPFDHPDLPDFSLSPVATVKGKYPGARVHLGG